MNMTLFQSLNKIRQDFKLTFKERKHLEVITHRALLQTKEGIGRPWVMPDEINHLQELRTERKDPRGINVLKLLLAVTDLLTKVYVEEANNNPQLEETLQTYNEKCNLIEEQVRAQAQIAPSTAVIRG